MARGVDGIGERGWGYWRIRTRAIHYESTGRILSYQSLLVSSSSSLPLARRPSLRPLYSYLPIYLSIGWMSECTNQALMHAKRRAEKLIVIHVRRLSHAFSTRRCPVRPAAGKINSRDRLVGPRINCDRCSSARRRNPVSGGCIHPPRENSFDPRSDRFYCTFRDPSFLMG